MGMAQTNIQKENKIRPARVYPAQNQEVYIIEYTLPRIRYNKKIKIIPFLEQDDGQEIPLTSVRGDTGWQSKKKLIRIEWDPVKQNSTSSASNSNIRLEPISEKIKAPVIESINYFGSNSAPFGVKYIFKTTPIPLYLATRIGALPPSYRDTISTKGEINYIKSGVYVVQNGRQFSSFAILGGFVARTGKNLYVNFGAGYGLEQLFWEIDEYNLDYKKIGSTWAITETTLKRKGEFFEAGLIWRPNRILFNLGASTVQFNVYQITFGFSFYFIR